MNNLSCDNISKFDIYLSALQWHLDEGIDVCYEENAIDRRKTVSSMNFAKGKAENKSPISPKLGAADAALEVRKLIESADNLDKLKYIIENFDGFAIKKTAMNMVFADGNNQAKIMVIGDVPRAEEDRQGKPFAGKNGVLLDNIFKSIKLSRDNIYITNVMNWRPPGNRSLTDSEISLAKLFIKKHIELINPDFLILLGTLPAKTLLDIDGGISKIRGKIFDYDNNIKAIITYHPENLHLNPLNKKHVWNDMLKIKDMI